MRVICAFARALAASLVLLVLMQRADAQVFGVGGGASAVNDRGSVAGRTGFETWEGHIFGEMVLEDDVTFQIRGSRFTLPGAGTGAPNLRVSSVTATVGYSFHEEWFRVGFFGGIGGYFIRPKTPGPGETVIDQDEDAFGWTGGLSTNFEVSRRLDVRLELSGHILRSDATHTPILLGLGFGYKF